MYSIVRRNMKLTGKFVMPDEEHLAPTTPELISGESIIGWYRNPEPWQECLIVFTDKAIYSTEEGNVFRLSSGCSSRPDADYRPFCRPPGGNGTTLCSVMTSA
jgi:hypothetical protein